MEAKSCRSCKVMVHNSQLKNLQYWLLPQKVKMLKALILHRESSEEKNTHALPFGLPPKNIVQIACSQNIFNWRPLSMTHSTVIAFPLHFFFPTGIEFKVRMIQLSFKWKKGVLSPPGSTGSTCQVMPLSFGRYSQLFYHLLISKLL